MVTGEMVADYERAALGSSIADLTAGDVTTEQWDDWLEGLRRRETVYREARIRLEALRSGEILPECKRCGETIVGRADARYCSTRCRVAAHRAKSKAEVEFVEPSAEERFQKLEKLRKQRIESGERPAPRTEEDRRADAREFVESLIARKRK
jgi:IS5 family transposase